MKKIIALTLVLVLLLAIAGCSAAGETKLGVGQYTKIASSKDLTENDEGVMVEIGRAHV